ncbi:MAG: hypothetical protein R6V13_02105 [Anaerolineae bacterium]
MRQVIHGWLSSPVHSAYLSKRLSIQARFRATLLLDLLCYGGMGLLIWAKGAEIEWREEVVTAHVKGMEGNQEAARI